MKKYLLLSLLSILTFSCNRDDNPQQEQDDLVKNIKIDFNRTGNWINPQEIDFTLQYDSQKRLVKQIGGFLPISSSTGFNGAFSKDIYTSLTYNSNNSVLVENFLSSPQYIVPKNTNIYTLNASNQILIREIPDVSQAYLNKKLTYAYNNNLLTEITTTFPNMPYNPQDPNDYKAGYVEKFFYDNNTNLVKTEFYLQINGENKNERIVRTFENYDTSKNPTKKLYLLGDYFYRSLSKNNFRKYTETHYNINNEITNAVEKSWSFNYDTNGNIIVN